MAGEAQHEEDVFHGKLDLALWRKVLVFARPHRRQLLRLVVAAAGIAVCDLLFPQMARWIIDALDRGGTGARLGRYAAIYVATIVTFAACVCAFIILAGRITTGVSFDIREACFDKLQALPFSFYDTKAVGWLMARLTSDCGALSRVMGWGLLDLTWGSIVLTSVSVVMIRMNGRLALMVLLVVPPLVLVSRFFTVRLLLTSRAQRKANSQTTAAFNEGIVGVKTSKSLVREERNLEEFRTLTGAMYSHALQNSLYSAMFLPIVTSICSVGVGLALWRGGVHVMWHGMSLGTLVAFLQYAGFVAGPVQELANTLTMVQGAQASAERVQGLLDTDVDIRDSKAVEAKIAAWRASDATARPAGIAEDGLSSRIERIEFRNVTFAYKNGQTVLHDFSLTVEAGQTIALVGPTGGGKSTIVGLLCQFYEPTRGQVLINGVDYRERGLHWLQSNLGMVLQQPHLFGGTIRENIRYGRLSATDAQVEEAARLVNAREFILAMKDGYDSAVGEGGNQLSTGQKQLIAMARAILANPQIFVMDEATSSVDTQTERSIQAAVETMLRNRISFVIAHRLSTIKSADRILVITGGRVVEQGSHHDLILARGRYYELYTNQFTHEREAAVLEYSGVGDEE